MTASVSNPLSFFANYKEVYNIHMVFLLNNSFKFVLNGDEKS
ncbi:hypothetical protein SAMN05421766_103749 [Zobellia uliginosa]|uniref:Uncharacterized protein n=1 Tax=Zobellia uliginosa TaxID=143224 RepID=A0ABY1KT73_9FLAO|nr:hypothetical protein SAMN05421766_103749 [Zobellia uliginosa]